VLGIQSLASRIVGYFKKAHGLVFLLAFRPGAVRTTDHSFVSANFDHDTRPLIDVPLADLARRFGPRFDNLVPACKQSGCN
jgi:hypothetical protein